VRRKKTEYRRQEKDKGPSFFILLTVLFPEACWLTPLLIRFDKVKCKSKKGTQKHETPGQDKPQTERVGLPEIAVEGRENPCSYEEGNGDGHRGDHAPQIRSDDPG
jgi:hypothetical protein